MANPGNQKVAIKLASEFSPNTINRILYKITPPGIYNGLNPTIVNNGTDVEFSPGETLITDDTAEHTAHFGVRDKVTISADDTAPIFVMGWQYDNATTDNYAYFDTTTAGNVAAHEIKLGKGDFDANGNVTSVSTDPQNDRDEIDLLNSVDVDTLSGIDEFIFSDTDGDGNVWSMREDGSGDLLVIHPELSSSITFNEDGRIENVSNPTNAQDVVTKTYANLSNILSEGNDAGSQQIANLQDPTNAQDAATKNYVDNVDLADVIGTDNSAGSQNIKDLNDPAAAQDAATKNYVDNKTSAVNTLQEDSDISGNTNYSITSFNTNSQKTIIRGHSLSTGTSGSDSDYIEIILRNNGSDQSVHLATISDSGLQTSITGIVTFRHERIGNVVNASFHLELYPSEGEGFITAWDPEDTSNSQFNLDRRVFRANGFPQTIDEVLLDGTRQLGSGQIIVYDQF